MHQRDDRIRHRAKCSNEEREHDDKLNAPSQVRHRFVEAFNFVKLFKDLGCVFWIDKFINRPHQKDDGNTNAQQQ